MAALDSATTCRWLRLITEEAGTVCPRNGGQRSPSVVPLMKVVSNTTSNHLVVGVRLMPTTVPRTAMGTLPESCTYTTRSPRPNSWFPSRCSASEGFISAFRGTDLIFFGSTARSCGWCSRTYASQRNA